MKKIFFLISFSIILSAFGGSHLTSAQGVDLNGLINNRNSYPEPDIPKPALGMPYIDPVFGMKITRITDYATEGGRRTPNYSLVQHFSADNKYFFLVTNTQPCWLLYDTATLRYIKTLTLQQGCAGVMPMWHATDPDVFYYVKGFNINKVNVATNTETVVRTITGTGGTGIYMGDKSGIMGLNGNLAISVVQGTTIQKIFVYNTNTDTVGPLHTPVGTVYYEGVKMSKSGNYVIYQVNGIYQAYAVNPSTLDLTFVRTFDPGDHPDQALDENGNDINVGLFSGSNKTEATKLSDGTTVQIFGPGWYGHPHHQSGTWSGMPGWVLDSYYTDYNHTNDGIRSPFEDEIFAIKTDGSGEVRRIAHHHALAVSNNCTGTANPGDICNRIDNPDCHECEYFSQPHASASRDGRYILFGSNWRDDSLNGGKAETYIIDLAPTNDTTPPASPTGLMVQ